MPAKKNNNKNKGQLRIRFKNLPQAHNLKTSAFFQDKTRYYFQVLAERKEFISKNVIFNFSKKDILVNREFFKQISFLSKFERNNLLSTAEFSRINFFDYLNRLNWKYDLKLPIEYNKDPRMYVKPIYSSRKISLDERLFLRFMFNFFQKSNKLKLIYLEYLDISKKHLETNLKSIKEKLEKEKLKEKRILESKSRISSQEAKEAKEAIESLEKEYARLYSIEENNYENNKKRIEDLTKKIVEITPEVIAGAKFIDFIDKHYNN